MSRSPHSCSHGPMRAREPQRKKPMLEALNRCNPPASTFGGTLFDADRWPQLSRAPRRTSRKTRRHRPMAYSGRLYVATLYSARWLSRANSALSRPIASPPSCMLRPSLWRSSHASASRLSRRRYRRRTDAVRRALAHSARHSHAMTAGDGLLKAACQRGPRSRRAAAAIAAPTEAEPAQAAP